MSALINRRRDRVNMLCQDRNGFWIDMKQHEKDAFDTWRPEDTADYQAEIHRAHSSTLLKGIDKKNAKFN